MNGQNKKGSNKKLILLFVGLIVIGIVCMKLKKTEHQENKQNKQKDEDFTEKLQQQFNSAFF